MRYTDDVGRGAWIGPRLRDWSTILGVAPSGYEAYARIFHPVGVQWIKWTDGSPRSLSEETLTWADAASRLGTTAHPLMQWGSLVQGHHVPGPGEGGWQWSDPAQGRFPTDTLATASAVLARHTSTGDRCTAALWEGFAWVNGGGATVVLMSDDVGAQGEISRIRPSASRPIPPAFPTNVLAGPRLPLPGRSYLLFETNVTELSDPGWATANGWEHSPNLLWPDDRAWCLASAIDFDSTLVGGSRALIDDLMAADELEVAELPPDASLQWDADVINGAPPHPSVE